MLALATSLFVAALLVFPELLQRTIINGFIPLKTIDRSRSEQLARAVFSVVIPLLIALYLVHAFQFLHRIVFHQYVSTTTAITPRADLKTFFSCLVSDERFKAAGDGFYDALGRLWQSAWPFVFTFYLLCGLIAVAIGLATRKYGFLREWSERHRSRRLVLWVINKLLLEKVSFWHALLTPFTLADKSGVLMLDVLCNNGVLYQGESYEYFLESEGKLAGLILKNPRRFERDEYRSARREAGGSSVDKESFWRTIPSKSLFINATTIVNLNINYLPVKRLPLEEVVRKYLAEALKEQRIKISISPVPPPDMQRSADGTLPPQ